MITWGEGKKILANDYVVNNIRTFFYTKLRGNFVPDFQNFLIRIWLQKLGHIKFKIKYFS